MTFPLTLMGSAKLIIVVFPRQSATLGAITTGVQKSSATAVLLSKHLTGCKGSPYAPVPIPGVSAKAYRIRKYNTKNARPLLQSVALLLVLQIS